MGETPLTFQDMILTLEHYWASCGCTVMQPYDSEVGAGTSIPLLPCAHWVQGSGGAAILSLAVVLRMDAMVYTWNCMQHYYQFQVLIKPSRGFTGTVFGFACRYWP